MRIVFDSVKPNPKSVNPELLFTFLVEEIRDGENLPKSFAGELYSEDDLKIADLVNGNTHQEYYYYFNARGGGSHGSHNNPIRITLTAALTERAIGHIENYRLNRKTESKDVVFKFRLQVQCYQPRIELAHLQVMDSTGYGGANEPHTVMYKYEEHFKPRRTDMWVLSGAGSPTYLTIRIMAINHLSARISLMDWVNDYTKYLGIGRFIVYEFLQPDETVFNKTLKDRFDRAQNALTEMQRLLKSGEWKLAVIAARPIVELFRNFDAFRSFMLEHGYSNEAFNALKQSSDGLFTLVSKFHHALGKNNTDLNPEIPVYTEDAHLLYSYCVSLLYLVSQKAKRV